jgi:hypothetical protein
MAAQLVDFFGQGRAEVRLVGVLLYRGALRTESYAQRKLADVGDLSAPLRFALALGPGGIECFVGDQRVAPEAQGMIPLPAEGGKWGFRSTDMSATIERIEIEL